MKYTYYFSNDEISEIEVSEADAIILSDMDRREYNNDHANTRRHISLDMAQEDEGMQFADPSTLEPTEAEQRMQIAVSMLEAEQQKMIRAIYFEDCSVSEYAKRAGVSQAAISQRLATIKKKIQKILSDPYI